MFKYLKHLFILIITLIILVSNLLPLSTARAQATVDYNYILSDSDLMDYRSMTETQIQKFLQAKSSTLANYIDPTTRLAASRIFYVAAQDFQINPKFLLALVQKEQSLIDNRNPSQYNYDWATGFAVCDSCSTLDPALQKFKGFYNQVYNASKRIRQGYLVSLYTTGKTITGFGPGIPKLVDGVTVTPANFATAVVYTYTPHLHGNLLFWNIWNRYFARAYPNGTAIRVEGQKNVWLIQNGQKRLLVTEAVMYSLTNPKKIIIINKNELDKYPEANPIKFVDYSFLQSPKGTVYLYANDTVRGFVSPQALRLVNPYPKIIKVSQETLALYTEKEPITTTTVFPLGKLIMDSKTGGVYFVQYGVKHPIPSPEVLRANFPGRTIVRSNATELAKYKTGAPVLFKDGTLLRAENTFGVYVITDSTKRGFVSRAAFTELGFSFSNVTIIKNSKVLELYPTGEPVLETY